MHFLIIFVNFLFFSRCARKARTCVASHKNQWILMIFQGALLRRRRRQDQEALAKHVKKSPQKISFLIDFLTFFVPRGPAAKTPSKMASGSRSGSLRGPPGHLPGGPRRPQEAPRATQDGPKSRQERPKSSQESSTKPFRIPLGPHRPPRGFRGGIWSRFGSISERIRHQFSNIRRLIFKGFR